MVKPEEPVKASPVERFINDTISKFEATAADLKERMPEVDKMTDFEKLSLYYMSGCRLDSKMFDGKTVVLKTMFPCGIVKDGNRYIVSEGNNFQGAKIDD